MLSFPDPVQIIAILSFEIIIAFQNVFRNIWYDFKFYITQKISRLITSKSFKREIVLCKDCIDFTDI